MNDKEKRDLCAVQKNYLVETINKNKEKMSRIFYQSGAMLNGIFLFFFTNANFREMMAHNIGVKILFFATIITFVLALLVDYISCDKANTDFARSRVLLTKMQKENNYNTDEVNKSAVLSPCVQGLNSCASLLMMLNLSYAASFIFFLFFI